MPVLRTNHIAFLMITTSGEEEELEVIRCPGCLGIFGVDASYIDQVDSTISCPMCLERIDIVTD